MPSDAPKAFISYSWSSSEHEEWVLNLATELRGVGVDIILDKWDLKEGHDAIAFMEQMVTDPNVKKVIIVCDREYSEKADKRTGGVGTEAQILSPKIYEKIEQDKFVAIIAERDDRGEPFVPTYYKGRIYIDLSDENLYTSNFEQLLRWIYDKPLYLKPELGDRPTFLSEGERITLGTKVSFNRAFDAIRNNKPHAKGAIDDYLNIFVENFENFRIIKNDEEQFDDQIVENIEKFIPYRNELIQFFIVTAQHREIGETWRQVHRFFEWLIPYMDRPEGITTWQQWDYDNFKFIIQELYIYFVSILARYERFDILGNILRQHYYVGRTSNSERGRMISFSRFRNHLQSLKHRNERLNARRLSMHADLLKQRSNGSGVRFEELMQGDFILFLRDCLEVIRNGGQQQWWPETLLYSESHHGPFEIFARAQSRTYFASVKLIFDIESADDLKLLMKAFEGGKLSTPHWEYSQTDIGALMNSENLGTRP